MKASNGVQIMLEEESNMLNEVVAIGYGSVKLLGCIFSKKLFFEVIGDIGKK